MPFVPKLELSEFATHLCSGILIGECLKFLIEAWRLSWQQFSTNILWYWCHIVPSTVMHNDDRMASDKTARSSPTLAWFPVCWLIHFVSHGWPLPTQSHWVSDMGCVGCTVRWYDMRRDSFLSPIQKCHSFSTHLVAPTSVSLVSVPLFVQQDCPRVDTTGKTPNKLSNTCPES